MSPVACRRDSTQPSAASAAATGFSLSNYWFALTVLAIFSVREVPGCECPARTVAESHTETETIRCPNHAAALQIYAAGAATLRQRALRAGIITYQDVIDAAYAPDVIDSTLQATKAHWRATVAHDFVFITDYAAVHNGAAVQTLVAVADPNLQSTLVAQYESTSNSIGIAPMATDFVIYHETGHALQRATLQARGAAADRRTTGPDFLQEERLRAGTADATTIRRLQYLCSQDEFEVRLQDLNRFHALLVAGRPIMNPTESVRALFALGVPLTYEETRDAFALGGQTLSREMFAQHLVVTPVESSAIAATFEDARELCLVRSFALRSDPTCWVRLLAKIIFEAPGHL